MEEYIKSEPSGVFRVKLVVKNTALGYPGSHFMQMRVKKMIKRIRKNTVLIHYT